LTRGFTFQDHAGAPIMADLLNFDVQRLCHNHVYWCFVDDDTGIKNLDETA
jgi:hypothetical protein